VLQQTLAQQAADERIAADDASALAQVLKRTDLAVLAVPVSAIVALLPATLEHASLVTDCGSTKREVAQAAMGLSRGDCWVGGHPMAGLPQSGLETARPDLFRGRSWIVCPGRAPAARVERVLEMVRAVGAVPALMSAEDHDRAVALSSHVPQLLASALTVLAGRVGVGQAAGPAFERATRTAGGADSMWRDIFATNADEVARTLRALGGELLAMADALGEAPPNTDVVMKLLAEARRLRGGP
jgi:prephenate dehydrogenase